SGVRLLQCLTNPRPDAFMTELLTSRGFHRMARLCYLELSPLVARRATCESARIPGMTWTIYRDELRGEFEAAISATYIDSRDCPALSTIRTAAEALDAHRHAGIFRPHRWLLARTGDRPAGCILLNEVPFRAALEVVYMGVVPEWRRQRVGRDLLARA